MLTEIICAGFGGQGVLTTGLLIAYAAHKNGKKITWYPSYGSEMRGGTANCTVKISDEEIASPYAKGIDILFTLNEPAIDKFEKQIKPGGYLFVNSSLVNENKVYRDDINVIKIDTNFFAAKANNPKGANIVMLGAVLKATKFLDFDQFKEGMNKYFSDKGKAKFNDLNVAALLEGYKNIKI
jgi:2-oxoglutarate ferredoxin oxidoreductase subunit gamma